MHRYIDVIAILCRYRWHGWRVSVSLISGIGSICIRYSIIDTRCRFHLYQVSVTLIFGIGVTVMRYRYHWGRYRYHWCQESYRYQRPVALNACNYCRCQIWERRASTSHLRVPRIISQFVVSDDHISCDTPWWSSLSAVRLLCRDNVFLPASWVLEVRFVS